MVANILRGEQEHPRRTSTACRHVSAALRAHSTTQGIRLQLSSEKNLSATKEHAQQLHAIAQAELPELAFLVIVVFPPTAMVTPAPTPPIVVTIVFMPRPVID